MLEVLDHTILLGFVQEAQSYTPTIQRGIIEFHQDATRLDEIQQAYRQVHTIKGAALMIGMEDLSEIAEELENTLEKFSNGDGAINAEQATFLLAQLEQIESLLDQASVNLQTSDAAPDEQTADNSASFSALLGDYSLELPAEFLADLPAGFSLDFDQAAAAEFAHEDDDQPAANNKHAATEIAQEADEEIDEEIDAEMLEVFALEAEEHLQIISANLQILEHNPQEREALSTIRRSSHTLKGAAGVMGFKTTSHLAHRMEDLLDHLAERPAASSAQTTALLLASTDALEKLSRGAKRSELNHELDNLYGRYESILPQLIQPQPEFQPNGSPQSKKITAVAAPQVETLKPIESFAVETNDSAILDFDEPKAAHANTGAQPQPQKTMVRVGLDKLDEMVKLMGEMIISRTTLEQRLKDCETQLHEMRLSTGRLRKIAGKLEIDYEANQLRSSDFGARIFGNNPLDANKATHFVDAPVFNDPKSAHGFDDLEFDRYTEFHELTRQLVETSTDTHATTGELDDLLGNVDALLNRQRRLSDDLQERMMRLRMVPLGTLATRLYRTVRVTADGEDKQVDLEIEGEDVEIDTQVLSSLVEPLLHLLRNAVVHGVEPSASRLIEGKPERGAIRLKAFYEGTSIVLVITDDGRGMNAQELRRKAVKEFFVTAEEAACLSDEQAWQLIFLPGFSTAARVNENAGRGVGMDIVRDSVQRQQGSVTIKSQVGVGTTMLLRLPMSLHVTRALVVRAAGQRFAIPLGVISSLAQTAATDFDDLTGEKILWVGSEFYPVTHLNALLDLPALAERDDERIQTLLIQIGEIQIALTLDEVIEAREIVIKPLEGFLKGARGLLGATILGDGSVVPILDVVSLLQPQANQGFAAAKTLTAVQPQTVLATPPKPQKAQLCVMIVDDSPSVRRVLSNLITKTGWQTTTAKDGLEAIELLQSARSLPDLILSDVEMPRMDGYELLSTLKRQESLAQIPVVMITSRAGDKHRQRALDLGASDYVVKPYQDSVLLDTIKLLANE